MSKDAEIAKEMIKKGKAMIAEAESKLAELEESKPELRHGDYGIDECGCGFVLTLQSSQDKFFYSDGCGQTDALNHASGHAVQGNIFDDLKRNSEDLNRTGDIYSKNGKTHANASIEPDGKIYMWASNSSNFEVEIAEKFHQKLGQVIATAKRKEAKK